MKSYAAPQWHVPTPNPLGASAAAANSNNNSNSSKSAVPFVPYTGAPPLSAAAVASSAPPVTAPPAALGQPVDVNAFRRVEKAPRVTPVAPAVALTPTLSATAPATQLSTQTAAAASAAATSASSVSSPLARTSASASVASPPSASTTAAAPVDPSRVPCPADRYTAERLVYRTVGATAPPPASDSYFVAYDEGNASPRFVRSSLYTVPNTTDLLKKSTLPFSLSITPLASLGPGEFAVPSVSVETSGPVRCARCMAYVCCAVQWQTGGRSFVCPICEHTNTIPDWYFAPVLPNGRRADAESRPELYHGTVDLIVGDAFRHVDRKTHAPLAHVYCIDVSYGAQKSGSTRAALAAVRSVIEHLDEAQLHNVALLTYSQTVHCYEVGEKLSRPRMLVVASEEPFALGGSVIATVRGQAKANLLAALDAIPTLHEGAHARAEADVGRAIRTAALMLQNRGGRVVVVMGSNPATLQDRLKWAQPRNILGTDEERVLYDVDTSNTYWKDLSQVLVAGGVSLDMFIACATYVDIGTLSWVTGRTGGRVFYYSDVTPGSYELKLQEELRLRQTRPQGFDGVMRIRTSKGVSITGYRGAFCNDRVSDELEMAAIDDTTTVSVDLTVDADIPAHTSVVLQVALLYTNSAGQRVVRLHTLSLPVSADLSAVFRLADVDATVHWAASSACAMALTQGIKHARGEVAKRVGEILASYRTYCAKNPAPGQLILPEALKMLPAFVLGLLKSALLRPSTAIGPHVRCHLVRCLIPFMAPAQVVGLTYPLAIPLADITDETAYGYPNEAGGIQCPPPLRLLRSSLAPGSVTLLDDGLSLRVFFSAETVDTERMSDLLSEPWSKPEIDIRFCPWDAIPHTTPWAQRVANVVAWRRVCDRHVFKNISVCKAGDPDELNFVNNTLIEDQIAASMSLTGFLRHLHQKIQSNK